MTDPNEDFCRKLCEEFGLAYPYVDEQFIRRTGPNPAIISAISKAIQIVMEKAARTAHDETKEHSTGNTREWCACCQSIRSLQLSAEDVRTEEK